MKCSLLVNLMRSFDLVRVLWQRNVQGRLALLHLHTVQVFCSHIWQILCKREKLQELLSRQVPKTCIRFSIHIQLDLEGYVVMTCCWPRCQAGTWTWKVMLWWHAVGPDARLVHGLGRLCCDDMLLAQMPGWYVDLEGYVVMTCCWPRCQAGTWTWKVMLWWHAVGPDARLVHGPGRLCCDDMLFAQMPGWYMDLEGYVVMTCCWPRCQAGTWTWKVMLWWHAVGPDARLVHGLGRLCCDDMLLAQMPGWYMDLEGYVVMTCCWPRCHAGTWTWKVMLWWHAVGPDARLVHGLGRLCCDDMLLAQMPGWYMDLEGYVVMTCCWPRCQAGTWTWKVMLWWHAVGPDARLVHGLGRLCCDDMLLAQMPRWYMDLEGYVVMTCCWPRCQAGTWTWKVMLWWHAVGPDARLVHCPVSVLLKFILARWNFVYSFSFLGKEFLPYMHCLH